MAFFFMSTRSHGSELPTGALVVCLSVESPTMGAGGASQLASGIGLSLSSCSARVGVRGTCRQSVSKGKGLDSCCSSGILAVGTEEDDGPDRCSSKGSEAFAFPFPLLRGSVLGCTVTPFLLSRMDLGSVGGGHAFPCGIGLTVNGLSDGETVLLPAIEIPADVEAVFTPQSSLGCAPHHFMRLRICKGEETRVVV
jgi:hypothetical protein